MRNTSEDAIPAAGSAGSVWARVAQWYVRYLLLPTTLAGGLALLWTIRYSAPAWGFSEAHAATLALCVSIPIACLWVITFEYLTGCAGVMRRRAPRRILADAGFATLSSFSLAFGHSVLAALPETGVLGGLSETVRLWERPFWLQLVVAFGISEITLYVWHRAQHESGSTLLWRFHAFHHRAPEMMSVTGGRASAVDLAMAMLSLSVVALLGVKSDALMFILWYSSMLGSLHHSDLDIRLGWLNWVIPGPHQHHAHHHIDPAVGRNYATNLPLLDVLFGTTTPLVRPGTIELGVHGDPERF